MYTTETVIIPKEIKFIEGEVEFSIPEQVVDLIYYSLLEAHQRLENGKLNIERCLAYLHKHFTEYRSEPFTVATIDEVTECNK